jgi:subtilisin family serine protease
MRFLSQILNPLPALVLAIGLALPSAIAAQPDHKGLAVHPSRILVQLKTGQSINSKAFNVALDKSGSMLRDQYRNLPGLLVLDAGDRHPRQQALRKKNNAVIRRNNLEERLTTLRKSGLFAFVEPDYVRHAHRVPTDSAFTDGRLWGLQNSGQSGGTSGADINVAAALDLTTGSRDVIVAIIDTGIRYTHQDLVTQMWHNPDEIPDNGVDDDQDGYVDNIHGINAVAEDFAAGNPMDNNGHGTHVAGTIGAAANDGNDHVGVAWEVSLMALKFLNDDGEGKTSDEIKCIDFAIANGANIINASYGGPGFSQAQEAAMRRAEAAGILFVAAAGNESGNNDTAPGYPASFEFPNVIAVASLNRQNQLSQFSNTGFNSVDIAAPGEAIFSCWVDSDTDYKVLSGTSMAAPHVAGVAALVLARFPNIGIPELRDLLLNTATPVGSFSGAIATGGRINAFAAVNAVADGELETNLSPAPGSQILAGSTLRLTLRITDLTDVTDATITGTVNGQPAPAFLNDASGPDQVAGDAIYTAEMVVPSFESGLTVSLEISAPGKTSLQRNFTYSIAVPAPNNDFLKATILEGLPITVAGSNDPADREPGEPRHANVDGGNSVWWTWIAPAGGPVVVETAGSDFDTVLAVYSGADFANLAEMASNDDVSSRRTTSRVSFDAAAGVAYAIAVDGYGGTTGNITLTLTPSSGTTVAPPNDNLVASETVSGSDAIVMGESRAATKESGEPNHAHNPGGRSIWYQWQAPSDGLLELGTSGSHFDTLLAVYLGQSVGSLTELAENDDGPIGDLSSHIELTVLSNATYRIAVDGFNGAGGQVRLHLQFNPTGPNGSNDSFANATDVGPQPVFTQGSNNGATKEAEEPDHAGNMGGHSVWWRWTADTDGLITVDLDGSDFDTLLAVYQGTSLANLIPISANDDTSFDSLASRSTFAAISGETYHIAVDGYADRDRIGDQGAITLRIAPFVGTVPDNDAFAARTPFQQPDFSATGSTLGATVESGEPAKAYNPGGASVWWSFTPTEPVLMEVTTVGSGFDTILAVFTGTDLTNLAEVASNDEADATQDPSSSVTFVARAGTEYLIALDGFNGQGGDFQLNVRRLGIVTGAYRTGFDSGSGFNAGAPLGGQQAWQFTGDGRHEITANGFPGSDQAALVGGIPSTTTNPVSHVFAWTPLDITPPAGRIVRFATRMSVNDSTNRIFDSFSWQIFNHQSEPLFGLMFDNSTLGISAILDDNSFQPSGFTFPNDIPFQLTIAMDFGANEWSAFINDIPVIASAPITVAGRQLTLNEIDAAWTINSSGIAGDNHMVFDNYEVDLIEPTVAPKILGHSPGVTVLEGQPVTLTVTTEGPGPLAYRWSRNAVPISAATQSTLVIAAAQVSDGGSYTVAVSNNYGGEISGPMVVVVETTAPPPGNDHFAAATQIISLPHFCQASNQGATTEPGEPQHGGKSGGSSVWWRWTATTSGIVTVSTLGSAFDTLIGVYQGASLSNLTEIVGNDDLQRRHRGSFARFNAAAGQIYNIAVDGFNGAHGNIRFWMNHHIDTRFRRPIRREDGMVDLDIETEAGITYILQGSTNLTDWADLEIITGGTAGIQLQDQSAAGMGARYYRLLLEP